jgi:hypothetical protein
VDKKLRASTAEWWPRTVLKSAQAGDPDLLIDRLRSLLNKYSVPLSAGEIEFIVDAIKRTASKRRADRIRENEYASIAYHVEELMNEGAPQKEAIEVVMAQHDCSRRTVYNVLRAYRSSWKSTEPL